MLPPAVVVIQVLPVHSVFDAASVENPEGEVVKLELGRVITGRTPTALEDVGTPLVWLGIVPEVLIIGTSVVPLLFEGGEESLQILVQLALVDENFTLI